MPPIMRVEKTEDLKRRLEVWTEHKTSGADLQGFILEITITDLEKKSTKKRNEENR